MPLHTPSPLDTAGFHIFVIPHSPLGTAGFDAHLWHQHWFYEVFSSCSRCLIPPATLCSASLAAHDLLAQLMGKEFKDSRFTARRDTEIPPPPPPVPFPLPIKLQGYAGRSSDLGTGGDYLSILRTKR